MAGYVITVFCTRETLSQGVPIDLTGNVGHSVGDADDVQSQPYVLMKYWNKRTQQGHTQFRNVPIGKVES